MKIKKSTKFYWKGLCEIIGSFIILIVATEVIEVSENLPEMKSFLENCLINMSAIVFCIGIVHLIIARYLKKTEIKVKRKRMKKKKSWQQVYVERRMHRKKFFLSIKKYFDNGLFRMVYADGNMAILCAGDLIYLVCPYFTLDSGDYFGFNIKKEHLILYMINNPKFFYKYLVKLDPLYFMKHRLEFSNRDYDIIKRNVDMCHKKGEILDLNYEFEERLKELTPSYWEITVKSFFEGKSAWQNAICVFRHFTGIHKSI